MTLPLVSRLLRAILLSYDTFSRGRGDDGHDDDILPLDAVTAFATATATASAAGSRRCFSAPQLCQLHSDELIGLQCCSAVLSEQDGVQVFPVQTYRQQRGTSCSEFVYFVAQKAESSKQKGNPFVKEKEKKTLDSLCKAYHENVGNGNKQSQ